MGLNTYQFDFRPELDLQNKKITNLEAGTDDTDAANVVQLTTPGDRSGETVQNSTSNFDYSILYSAILNVGTRSEVTSGLPAGVHSADLYTTTWNGNTTSESWYVTHTDTSSQLRRGSVSGAVLLTVPLAVALPYYYGVRSTVPSPVAFPDLTTLTTVAPGLDTGGYTPRIQNTNTNPVVTIVLNNTQFSAPEFEISGVVASSVPSVVGTGANAGLTAYFLSPSDRGVRVQIF